MRNLFLFYAEDNFTASNNSLSALKASVGKSYKCRAEESIWVTKEASVNIFDVQIQAFKIEGGNFGAGEIFVYILKIICLMQNN